MTVLLLGTAINSNTWQIIHKTKSYKAMAKELDLYYNRDKYQQYAIISDTYFDYETNSITDTKKAFAKTPRYCEEAFLKAAFDIEHTAVMERIEK